MFHSFHNCCQSFLFSHRHRLGLKRQMKKMQDICNKETKTTAASLTGYMYYLNKTAINWLKLLFDLPVICLS